MATIMEPRAPGILSHPRNNLLHTQPLLHPYRPPDCKAESIFALDRHLLAYPDSWNLLRLERTPVFCYDDNPVFTEFGAAYVLGLSAES